MTLYTDIDPYCCAVLASRVEDGGLPPGDVMMADVRDLDAARMADYRHVHLFCGIGGLPLGVAWAGWPERWSLVTGGFPCQDISAAGKGAGLDGERSGLFWELHRVISIKRPDVFIAENVGALGRRGLDVVAAALESLGYTVEALRMGAWSVGAPHERERWWIVGWRTDGPELDAHGDGLRAERERGAGREPDGGGEAVQPDARRSESEQRRDADMLGRRPREAQQAGMGDRLQRHADGGGRREHEQGRQADRGAAAGWPVPGGGDWKRTDYGDGWQFTGAPLLVHPGGSGRQEREPATEPGGARFAAGRPDPTVDRGWPVPVLPGYTQREWERPRLYQRGMGDAVHGVPGRMAGPLNKCGVMALGNAVVPQVVAAIAGGLMAAMSTQWSVTASNEKGRP